MSATIQDVARLANVSNSTVSRVLNHDETLSVSDETRDRILAIARKLNYQRDTRGRKRHTSDASRDRKIGLILLVSEQQVHHDPYFQSIQRGVEEECASLGIHPLHVMRVTDSKSLKDVALDGVIVVGENDDVGRFLIQRYTNLVFVDYSPSPNMHDFIVIDYEAAVKQALDHLISLGHQSIGYVGGYRANGRDERQQYFELYMRARGLYDPRHVYICDWLPNAAYEVVQGIITSVNRPKALFFGSDPLAIAGLRALHEHGIRIPDELAVVGVDGIQMAEFSNPPLSTIMVHPDTMGRIALKLLLDRISGRTVPLRVLVAPQLVVRESSMHFKEAQI